MKEHRRFYELCRAIVTPFIHFVEKLDVTGLENIPVRGPVIMVGNHITFMDIPTIGFYVKRHQHHMGKIELFRVPVLGAIMRGLDAFPVRRGEGDRESLRTAEELLGAGQMLVVFPEGHRSRTGKMAAGLAGVALIAMRTGAPIVPVGIAGTERVLKGHYGPWAPTVHVVYGTPFTLEVSGKRRREDLERGIDTIMRHIAALVPPEYRGVYADAPAAAALNASPVVAETSSGESAADASVPPAGG